jgi:hypothetical protein
MVTTWPDVSEWQTPVTDAFTGPLICTRSSLSNFKVDNNIGKNSQWQQRKHKSGQLAFEFYYHVWYPGNEAQQHDLALRSIGGARAGVAMMLDLETWGGAIGGNHTASIDNLRLRLARTLGGEAKVPVYGNGGDLRELYPGRPPNVPTILASYGSSWWRISGNQAAQQYTNGIYQGPKGLPTATAPFGRCDFNGALLDIAQISSHFGHPDAAVLPTRKVPAMYEVLRVDGSGEFFQYSELVFQHIATTGELQRVAASPLNAAGPGKFRVISRLDREHYRNIVFRNVNSIRGKAN